jgi:cytoskeleton protein RodZ
MNESTQTPSPVTLAQESPTASMTAGGLLQQARERSGMQLEMLSVALKVSVRHLKALEADDHAQFSGPAFVRALAGSVCRQLKVDAEPVLALLPPATTHLQPLPSSLQSAGADWRPRSIGRSPGVNRKFLLWAGVLMVLIALVLWLPQWPVVSLDSTPAPTSTGVTAADNTAISSAQSPPLVVLLPSDPAQDVESSRALTSGKMPSATTSETSAVSPLEVIFKGKADESWVEVKDNTGAVIFSKLVKSGDTHVVKGLPVLTVVVGLSDAVDVWVRGQALDLSPFSRGAVARFEVK